MSKAHKVKSDFLGMPYPTACGRLRKMVLFRLVQRVGEDVCFRCGGRIETVEELSIEHKKEWLRVSKELFWDLDNLSFSHLACNSGAHRNGKMARKGPDGTLWCGDCRDFVSIKKFGRIKRRRPSDRGFRYNCNDCRKKKGWGRGPRDEMLRRAVRMAKEPVLKTGDRGENAV